MFQTNKNVAVVGLASRILQVGPRGSKFLGPVLIEVPHVASLCNDDREVVVLRCDSASKGKWTEHVQDKLDDKTLKVCCTYNSVLLYKFVKFAVNNSTLFKYFPKISDANCFSLES